MKDADQPSTAEWLMRDASGLLANTIGTLTGAIQHATATEPENAPAMAEALALVTRARAGIEAARKLAEQRRRTP